MRRALPSKEASSPCNLQTDRFEEPRTLRRTVIDFKTLGLPLDVSATLAQAFWSHFGVQAERAIYNRWCYMKTYGRFVRETEAVASLDDLNGAMLRRYVEWLNSQCRPNANPWAKSSRASTYNSLRMLLLWIERCLPNRLQRIDYPYNPFPWRNRDTAVRAAIPPGELRAILRACEADIARIRTGREAARLQRTADAHRPGTLGWLLEQIDRKFDGIVPEYNQTRRTASHPINAAISRHGGLKQVAPCLYPLGENLLPYYIAIMIHTAGNPESIAELRRGCLEPIPLLHDRDALVWFKARASSLQRRTFSKSGKFEPPTLIREIVEWNKRLVPHADAKKRDFLFLYKGIRAVTSLNSPSIKYMLKDFCERHQLKRFALASIRPGVLSSFYRASGNLSDAAAVANHANLSTTVRYVQAPGIQENHRIRVADLQTAFVGHLKRGDLRKPKAAACGPPSEVAQHSAPVVSMFGFDCSDPYAGVAPGTQRGSLCANYMGCFTCPNAIITGEASRIARLLQARDHLRASAASLHPARWQLIYSAQLRILEEDILPRFSVAEIADGERLCGALSPLPELR